MLLTPVDNTISTFISKTPNSTNAVDHTTIGQITFNRFDYDIIRQFIHDLDDQFTHHNNECQACSRSHRWEIVDVTTYFTNIIPQSLLTDNFVIHVRSCKKCGFWKNMIPVNSNCTSSSLMNETTTDTYARLRQNPKEIYSHKVVFSTHYLNHNDIRVHITEIEPTHNWSSNYEESRNITFSIVTYCATCHRVLLKVFSSIFTNYTGEGTGKFNLAIYIICYRLEQLFNNVDLNNFTQLFRLDPSSSTTFNIIKPSLSPDTIRTARKAVADMIESDDYIHSFCNFTIVPKLDGSYEMNIDNIIPDDEEVFNWFEINQVPVPSVHW